MNYLAHFHLAWPEELLVVGGLEGDFHKGPLPGTLAPALHAGVALHRAIDAYTDSHAVVAELRRQFPPQGRRYAGILIDLCFDYFLARHWSSYSEMDHSEFSEAVYGILEKHATSLSGDARHMAGRLCEFDVLNRYQHWETIIASAHRIGQRLRRSNPLAESEEMLAPLVPELERAFLVFYPDLIRFSRGDAMLGGPR